MLIFGFLRKKKLKNPFLVKFSFKITYSYTITYSLSFNFIIPSIIPCAIFASVKTLYQEVSAISNSPFQEVCRKLEFESFHLFSAFRSVDKHLMSCLLLLNFKRFSSTTFVKFAFVSANFVTNCPHTNFPHN